MMKMRLKCVLAMNILFLVEFQSVFASGNEGSRGRTLPRVNGLHPRNYQEVRDQSGKEDRLRDEMQRRNLNFIVLDDFHEDEASASWRTVPSPKNLFSYVTGLEEDLEGIAVTHSYNEQDVVAVVQENPLHQARVSKSVVRKKTLPVIVEDSLWEHVDSKVFEDYTPKGVTKTSAVVAVLRQEIKKSKSDKQLFSYKSQLGQSDVADYDARLDFNNTTMSLEVQVPDDDSSSNYGNDSDKKSDDGL